jgi:hypothetical protein
MEERTNTSLDVANDTLAVEHAAGVHDDVHALLVSDDASCLHAATQNMLAIWWEETVVRADSIALLRLMTAVAPCISHARKTSVDTRATRVARRRTARADACATKRVQCPSPPSGPSGPIEKHAARIAKRRTARVDAKNAKTVAAVVHDDDKNARQKHVKAVAAVVHDDDMKNRPWVGRLVAMCIERFDEVGATVPHLVLSHLLTFLLENEPSPHVPAFRHRDLCEGILKSRNDAAISMLVDCLRRAPTNPVQARVQASATASLRDRRVFRYVHASRPFARFFAPLSSCPAWEGVVTVLDHDIRLHDLVVPLLTIYGCLPGDGDGWDAILTSRVFKLYAVRIFSEYRARVAPLLWQRMPVSTHAGVANDMVSYLRGNRKVDPVNLVNGALDAARDGWHEYLAVATVVLCRVYAGEYAWIRRDVHTGFDNLTFDDSYGCCMYRGSCMKFLKHAPALLHSPQAVENVLSLAADALMCAVHTCSIPTYENSEIPIALLMAQVMSQEPESAFGVDKALGVLISRLHLKAALSRLVQAPTPMLEKYL